MIVCVSIIRIIVSFIGMSIVHVCHFVSLWLSVIRMIGVVHYLHNGVYKLFVWWCVSYSYDDVCNSYSHDVSWFLAWEWLLIIRMMVVVNYMHDGGCQLYAWWWLSIIRMMVVVNYTHNGGCQLYAWWWLSIIRLMVVFNYTHNGGF